MRCIHSTSYAWYFEWVLKCHEFEMRINHWIIIIVMWLTMRCIMSIEWNKFAMHLKFTETKMNASALKIERDAMHSRKATTYVGRHSHLKVQRRALLPWILLILCLKCYLGVVLLPSPRQCEVWNLHWLMKKWYGLWFWMILCKMQWHNKYMVYEVMEIIYVLSKVWMTVGYPV